MTWSYLIAREVANAVILREANIIFFLIWKREKADIGEKLAVSLISDFITTFFLVLSIVDWFPTTKCEVFKDVFQKILLIIKYFTFLSSQYNYFIILISLIFNVYVSVLQFELYSIILFVLFCITLHCFLGVNCLFSFCKFGCLIFYVLTINLSSNPSTVVYIPSQYIYTHVAV